MPSSLIYSSPRAAVYRGDCVTTLPLLKSGVFDLVLTDPPYPGIDRHYGKWTVPEWFAMMRRVVPECMRVLKPTGSAVFILQPNSERIGRMRTWLWDFCSWVGKEWGIVQDAYWWNTCSPPAANAIAGGLRPSVKYCVWVGPPDCYKDQLSVLWEESKGNAARRLTARFCGREYMPSGHSWNELASRDAAVNRGGSTPFNLLPIGGVGSGGDESEHGARTPLQLCDWWVRYLCPPGGKVLDPFFGTGTVGLAALGRGCSCVGIEKLPEWAECAARRLEEWRPKKVGGKNGKARSTKPTAGAPSLFDGLE